MTSEKSQKLLRELDETIDEQFNTLLEFADIEDDGAVEDCRDAITNVLEWLCESLNETDADEEYAKRQSRKEKAFGDWLMERT